MVESRSQVATQASPPLNQGLDYYAESTPIIVAQTYPVHHPRDLSELETGEFTVVDYTSCRSPSGISDSLYSDITLESFHTIGNSSSSGPQTGSRGSCYQAVKPPPLSEPLESSWTVVRGKKSRLRK